jgi:hypothetical protein
MSITSKFPGKPIAVYHNQTVRMDNRDFKFEKVEILKYQDHPKLKERMLFFAVSPPTPILGYLSTKGNHIDQITLKTDKGRTTLKGCSIYQKSMYFVIFCGAVPK